MLSIDDFEMKLTKYNRLVNYFLMKENIDLKIQRTTLIETLIIQTHIFNLRIFYKKSNTII